MRGRFSAGRCRTLRAFRRLARAERFLARVRLRRAQTLLLLQRGELLIDLALLLQQLEAVLHGVGVELAEGRRARLLQVDFLLDALKAGQRAALVEAGEGAANLGLRLGAAAASDQQLLLGRCVLDLRLELLQRLLQLFDLTRLLLVLGLEPRGGLGKRVAAR